MGIFYWALVFATGASGLIFQITWQRYLSFLVGAEARSISLVVGVFLLGLAAGYRYWGSRTRRRSATRSELLRLYGRAEIAIGAYALAFPVWFMVVRKLAYGLPDSFALDCLFAGLLLLAPTFLMGATVPLLTASLPKHVPKLDAWHARIYGLNTAGAVLGCWLGAFVLIPRLGLRGSLVVGAAIDIAAGAAFVMLARRLRSSEEAGDPSQITSDLFLSPEPLASPVAYGLAFISGAVTIALEMWLVRLVSLSIGGANYVFALVTGLFVFGLGIGSLSLGRAGGRGGFSPARVTRELAKASIATAALYFLVPYWPNWLAALRLVVGNGAISFNLYLIAAALLLGALWLWAIVPLGRLLPLAYATIPKTKKDYGQICGNIYFINTLGTLVGAWFLGHGLLQWMNLDRAYKVGVTLVALAAIGVFWAGRRKKLVLAFSAGLALFLASPDWDRASYYIGLFRTAHMAEYRYEGFFKKPGLARASDIEFYKDGPDATVVVERVSRDAARRQESGALRASRSIVVNGKSDGNTIGDFSTMALVATLPYLALEKPSNIKAAVIGLGTGVTAGLLSHFRDVSEVTVVEISQTVIDASLAFDQSNYALSRQQKARIERADAFRFFARTASTFDLVVSEPSNPWVAGVENLFTPEYYDLIKTRLAPRGAYVQWIHLYEMSEPVLGAVFRNIAQAFGRAEVYLVGPTDLAIIASPGRERRSSAHLARRFVEPFVRDAHVRIGIAEQDDLSVLHAFDERYLRWYAGEHAPARVHDLEHPWLSDFANVARFQGSALYLEDIIRADLDRDFFSAPGKGEAILRLLAKFPTRKPACLDARISLGVFCLRYASIARARAKMLEAPVHEAWSQLLGYGALRREGLVPSDRRFLAKVRQYLLAHAKDLRQADLRRESAVRLLREFRLDKDFEGARNAEKALRSAWVLEK